MVDVLVREGRQDYSPVSYLFCFFSIWRRLNDDSANYVEVVHQAEVHKEEPTEVAAPPPPPPPPLGVFLDIP